MRKLSKRATISPLQTPLGMESPVQTSSTLDANYQFRSTAVFSVAWLHGREGVWLDPGERLTAFLQLGEGADSRMFLAVVSACIFNSAAPV